MGFPFWFIMKLNELIDTFIKILIVENLNEHILNTTFFLKLNYLPKTSHILQARIMLKNIRMSR